MTERSGPWDGTSIGDASEAAYDAPTEFARFLEGLHGGTSNRGGVVVDKLNELAITAPGSISPASVASGWAYVYGGWYESDAAVSVAIPTPAVSTRIDRIVLRKDWAAQTIRVTRIAGVEGAGAPALVQTVGTTWDLPLAQASITTGGVITLTDQRVFLPVHGNRSGESGTHHAASQISGLVQSADSTPVKSTYGAAGVIGADVDNFSNDDHVHPLDEESRGAVARAVAQASGNTALATMTSFPVTNGDTWVGRAIVKGYNGADGTDIKVAIVVPAGTLKAYLKGPTIGSPAVYREAYITASGVAEAFEIDITGGDLRVVSIDFQFIATATGTLAIQAAQQTNNASPINVDVILTATKI